MENRKNASTAAYRIAREIENLLNFMNQNKADFVVSDEEAVIFEDDMHLHISQYMRLGKSFEKEKPCSSPNRISDCSESDIDYSGEDH